MQKANVFIPSLSSEKPLGGTVFHELSNRLEEPNLKWAVALKKTVNYSIVEAVIYTRRSTK